MVKWMGRNLRGGLQRHCEQRAIERYGVDIGWCGRTEIRELLKRGEGLFLGYRKGGSREWVLLYKETLFHAITDRKCNLITFFPPKKLGDISKHSFSFRDRFWIAISILKDGIG